MEVHNELSAGGVVIRRTSEAVEVLLGEQWDRNRDRRTVRLPKGHLDPGESLEEAALREVLEETGRSARILEQLEEVSYRFVERKPQREVRKRVVFFLMEDLGGPDGERDAEMERVFWAPIEAAATRLSFETERAVVRRAAERLP